MHPFQSLLNPTGCILPIPLPACPTTASHPHRPGSKHSPRHNAALWFAQWNRRPTAGHSEEAATRIQASSTCVRGRGSPLPQVQASPISVLRVRGVGVLRHGGPAHNMSRTTSRCCQAHSYCPASRAMIIPLLPDPHFQKSKSINLQKPATHILSPLGQSGSSGQIA